MRAACPPQTARSAAEITGTGVVLRERRAESSTHVYDFDDATGAIIGCALEVHRTLGPGFREISILRVSKPFGGCVELYPI